MIEFISDRARHYVGDGPAGTDRFKRLPSILRQLPPFTKEYVDFAAELDSRARELGVTVHELADRSEWPEFKW